MCERAREREGQGQQWRDVVSLPPSPVAGNSIRKPTGELLWRRLRGGGQELGGVVSCGAGVRLVSTASYGTSCSKTLQWLQLPPGSQSKSPHFFNSTSFPSLLVHLETWTLATFVCSTPHPPYPCQPPIALLNPLHLPPPRPSPTLQGTGYNFSTF